MASTQIPDTLSTDEIARLASLDALEKKPETYDTQIALKQTLIKRYGEGYTDATKDKWKAKKYQEDIDKHKKHTHEESKYDNKITPPLTQNFRINTQLLYDSLGWYTSGRLIFSRANRVADTAFHHSASTQTVPIRGEAINLGAIVGLSYGLELFIDLCILIKHLVMPDAFEKKLTAWERFKNAVMKDVRLPRMVNAIGWFTINLICLLPPARALVGILNISLFAYDLLHDKFREKYSAHEDAVLLQKLNSNIESAQKNSASNDQMAALLIQRNELIKNAEIKNNAKVRSTRISAGVFVSMLMFYFPSLLLFAVAFTVLYAATEAPKNSAQRAGLIALGLLAAGAAVGLLLFPPAQLAIAAISAAVTLTGAILSLVVGSLYGGFGPRIVKLIGQFFAPTPHSTASEQEMTPETTPLLQQNRDEKSIETPNSPLPHSDSTLITFSALHPTTPAPTPLTTSVTVTLPQDEKRSESPLTPLSDISPKSSPSPTTPPKNIRRSKSYKELRDHITQQNLTINSNKLPPILDELEDTVYLKQRYSKALCSSPIPHSPFTSTFGMGISAH